MSLRKLLFAFFLSLGAWLVPSPAAAQLVLSQPALTFVDQPINSASTPQIVTVTNTGSPLFVGAVLLSGPDAPSFSARNLCFGQTLATGESCTVAVAFAPLHAGPAHANLFVGDLGSVAQLDGNGIGTTPTYVVPHFQIKVLDIPYEVDFGGQLLPFISAFNNHDDIAGAIDLSNGTTPDCTGDGEQYFLSAFVVSNGVFSLLTDLPNYPLAGVLSPNGRCPASSRATGLDDAGEVFLNGSPNPSIAGPITSYRYAQGVFTPITSAVINDSIAGATADGVVVFQKDWSYWFNGNLIDLQPIDDPDSCGVIFDAVNRTWVDLGKSAGLQAGLFCYGDFNPLGNLGGYTIGITTTDDGRYTGSAYRSGVLIDDGLLDPSENLWLSSINSAGQAVGRRGAPGQGNGSVFWDPRTGIHDLADLLPLGWSPDMPCNNWPLRINDLGHILVGACDPASVLHLVVLTPIASAPVGSNVVAQSGTTTLTFSSVTAPGDTTVVPIDPSTTGTVPGGFAISDTMAYQISTTAGFNGPVTLSFIVPGQISQSDFANLRVLHNQNGVLVDITSGSDYPSRTLYATTTSFSPFYIARQGIHISPLFDTSRAFKSGSTIPIKLQVLNANGSNASSAGLAVKTRKLTRLQDNSDEPVIDTGNANPDSDFRFDPTIGGNGGYIFNMSTKGLARGRYSLSLYVGGDKAFIYSVSFDVR